MERGGQGVKDECVGAGEEVRSGLGTGQESRGCI